ncbi:hypothetical protein AAMO2058_001197900 [Amorphochlora amoebiformis]
MVLNLLISGRMSPSPAAIMVILLIQGFFPTRATDTRSHTTIRPRLLPSRTPGNVFLPQFKSHRRREVLLGRSSRDFDVDVDSDDEENVFERVRDALFGKGRIKPTRRWMRSYVSDVEQFTSNEKLREAKNSINTAEFLEDKTEDSKYFSFGYQIVLLSAAYLSFPFIQRLIAPVLDGQLVESMASSITGTFGPPIDVIYALLASTVIGELSERQETIQDVVNNELVELRVLTWLIIQLADDYSCGPQRVACERILVDLWRYTDFLVFSSRTMELNRVVADDILLKSHKALNNVQIASPDCVKDQNQKIIARIQDSASQAKLHVETLLALRTQRLNKEGQGIVPAVLAILDLLSIYILTSFPLLSAIKEFGPDATDLGWSISSMSLDLATRLTEFSNGHGLNIDGEAALFASLVSSIVTIRSLWKDLEGPFQGHSRIRRTVSTTTLFTIRSDIEEILARDGLCDLLTEVKSLSKSAKESYDRTCARFKGRI